MRIGLIILVYCNLIKLIIDWTKNLINKIIKKKTKSENQKPIKCGHAINNVYYLYEFFNKHGNRLQTLCLNCGKKNKQKKYLF